MTINKVWSAELATIAQRWADQCNYEHDKTRNSNTRTKIMIILLTV